MNKNRRAASGTTQLVPLYKCMFALPNNKFQIAGHKQQKNEFVDSFIDKLHAIIYSKMHSCTIYCIGERNVKNIEQFKTFFEYFMFKS